MPQLNEQATPQQVMDANKAEEDRAAAAAAKEKPEAGAEAEEEEDNPLADEKGEKGEGDSEGTEGDDDAGGESKEAKPKVPWYKREIAKLKGKLNLSVAENQSLKSAMAQQKKVDDAAAEEETEELDADGKPKPKPAKAKPAATGLSEEDVERRANEKAAATVAQNEFNKQCNTAFDNGEGEFKDWDEAVENLKEVGALDNIPFLQAVLESEFPHRVLHELAQDQDEAARISSLPPIKMAVAVAKLKGTQPKEKKTSKAPDRKSVV